MRPAVTRVRRVAAAWNRMVLGCVVAGVITSFIRGEHHMSGPYEQTHQQNFPAAQPFAPVLPASNAGWAVVAVIFFWPLAIPAFNHALKVHPLWSMGDVQGAQYSSQRAAFFGKLSLIIFGVFIVLYLAFIGLVVSNM
ncbi:hypothetical protein CH278_19705 [Rhodococcus sp. 05-2254-5]|nr:hypothetical protein CH278_19705 [Rhodococcus sp. 05-2254-5]OZE53775.1 hypothetical protein CH269_21920 [Rhodococcus sp. 05-2254-1]RZL73279.1 MAG: CD225/dispanin family protein [Rhodococcus sp. (in: high G+C Gram-positive bacteria)]